MKKSKNLQAMEDEEEEKEAGKPAGQQLAKKTFGKVDKAEEEYNKIRD